MIIYDHENKNNNKKTSREARANFTTNFIILWSGLEGLSCTFHFDSIRIFFMSIITVMPRYFVGNYIWAGAR